MPEYEHKINTGTLFTNKFKTGESHPDFTGKANVNGDMKDLSMWYNEEKKYYYIKINEPYVKKDTGKESPAWQKAREKLGPQEVPVVGTLEDDGTINYDEPIDLSSIPF